MVADKFIETGNINQIYTMKNGESHSSELIETDSLLNHTIVDNREAYFNDPYFENTSPLVTIYNPNNHTGYISVIENYSDAPYAPVHSNVLEVHTTSKSDSASNNNLIGFGFGNTSVKGKVFIYHIYAKIPSNCSIESYETDYGTGSKKEWLTSTSGTGKWEEYILQYTFGSSGTFSKVGYFYFKSNDGTFQSNFSAYIAAAFCSDITDCPYHKYITLNPSINLRLLPTNQTLSIASFIEKVTADGKTVQIIPYKDSFPEPDYWYCWFPKNYTPSDNDISINSLSIDGLELTINDSVIALATTEYTWTKEIPAESADNKGMYLWRKWVYRNTNIYENTGIISNG